MLLYDGACAFCTRCARALERIGPDAAISAWQLADLAALGITEQQAADAVQWVRPDGAALSGSEAIAAALTSAAGIYGIAGRALMLPGVSRLAATAYRLVAENRQRLPGGTAACAADDR